MKPIIILAVGPGINLRHLAIACRKNDNHVIAIVPPTKKQMDLVNIGRMGHIDHSKLIKEAVEYCDRKTKEEMQPLWMKQQKNKHKKQLP